jgi:hypothetical protein
MAAQSLLRAALQTFLRNQTSMSMWVCPIKLVNNYSVAGLETAKASQVAQSCQEQLDSDTGPYYFITHSSSHGRALK